MNEPHLPHPAVLSFPSLSFFNPPLAVPPLLSPPRTHTHTSPHLSLLLGISIRPLFALLPAKVPTKPSLAAGLGCQSRPLPPTFPTYRSHTALFTLYNNCEEPSLACYDTFHANQVSQREDGLLQSRATTKQQN